LGLSERGREKERARTPGTGGTCASRRLIGRGQQAKPEGRAAAPAGRLAMEQPAELESINVTGELVYF